MISIKPEKGHLLVAEPSIMGDVSFSRSVVLIAEYNQENGSVGFILNKPLEYKLKDFVPEVNSSLTVYNGGPVEQDNLYFIHTIPDLIPNSVEISNGIYWGGDFKAIIALLENDSLTEKQIRFFLGYSGWANAQLEEELSLNSWKVVPNKDKDAIIWNSKDDFWKKKMIEFGGDYVMWSNAPENPSYN